MDQVIQVTQLNDNLFLKETGEEKKEKEWVKERKKKEKRKKINQ